ncbi:MAG: hypothetical protein ACOZFS_08195 [Thermodesulfobacteriota bacterium]
MPKSEWTNTMETGPQPGIPLPPTIGGITWNGLTGIMKVIMPTSDTDQGALNAPFVDIFVQFCKKGEAIENGTVMQFPGSYPAGSEQIVTVTVPAFGLYEWRVQVDNTVV